MYACVRERDGRGVERDSVFVCKKIKIKATCCLVVCVRVCVFVNERVRAILYLDDFMHMGCLRLVASIKL